VRHDRLCGQGQVQDEFAVVLVEPNLARLVRAAGELAWPAIVETAAAVVICVATTRGGRE
jgi:hypothetical protein